MSVYYFHVNILNIAVIILVSLPTGYVNLTQFLFILSFLSALLFLGFVAFVIIFSQVCASYYFLLRICFNSFPSSYLLDIA
jgi:hypothetical protein